MGVLAGIGGCTVGPVSYLGKTCTTACPEGLVCLAGVCASEPSGEGDGGATEGGGATAGCDADVRTAQQNCGWCGHDCRGLACSNGVCDGEQQIRASVQSMVIDHGTLFYASDSAIYAYAIATAGGSSVKLAPVENAAYAVSAHAPQLVWCDADGTVNLMRQDGGPVTRLAFNQGCRCSAVNSTHVYWWAQANQMPYRIPIDADAGSAEPFFPLPSAPAEGCVRATEQLAVVAIDRVLVYHDLTSQGAAELTPRGPIEAPLIALTQGDAYFVTTDDGGVAHVYHSVARSNTAALIATSTGPISALVADDSGVFWDEPDGYVHGCADSRCTTGERRYAKAANAGALAVDDTWIYVAVSDPSPGGATVFRYAR